MRINDKTRIRFFDIECTSLNASFGHVICFGDKELNKRARVMSLTDFEPATMDQPIDYHLVRWIHDSMMEDDIFVSYYGTGYDWPFLKTRMLMANLPPMPPCNTWTSTTQPEQPQTPFK